VDFKRRFDWSGGQAMNLHFQPQGPASYS